MSKAQLKKTLARMDASEIAEMVTELYDARPEAKEYLEYWLNPDPQKELEKYKLRIHRLFFTASGRARKRPTITSIRQVVKYFTSICFDPDLIAELYVYICTVDVEWLDERRNPLPALKAVRTNIDTARLYVENSGLEDRFGLKLDQLLEKVDALEERGRNRGYGFGFRWRRKY